MLLNSALPFFLPAEIQVIASLQKVIETLNNENGGLKEEVASLKEEATSLKEEAASLKEEVASLNEEAASLKEEVASLKEEVPVASLKEEVASLKEEVASLEGRIERGIAQSDELDDEISLLINHTRSGRPFVPAGAPPTPTNTVSNYPPVTICMQESCTYNLPKDYKYQQQASLKAPWLKLHFSICVRFTSREVLK